ncbi:TPA: formate dehydrogenase subunit alpha [Enterococcus faecalis]|uniref:formate dehydrogenase subunit alpha n=1 Tax=Enterococcus TaxID=1350 RepID=UPI0001B2BEB7|nr:MULTISPECIES: formate dehydrogenase subunit alpha [Enterococcus]HAP3745330.1 formate dehydrogenase subunit alpha [Enterococcus faecalis TDR28]HAP3751258.1 formate dehydrogenase subunit alpha [Enterococcus faecalis TDR22]HAP3754258.1 formate dehydrogenase subunit alpha [Enterococcus faecalis TDR13]HAP3757243.1 formate dehydrogenase subunit alpha [Enterococcus faecalis TDR7]HAP3768848.1 formate dehydrogenase subunit alpha [Enterococcus faecalis TDR19]HAP4962143.1 formate dehydrogenase subuni
MKTKLHTQTVTLSIDNQEVTVPKGTTILEAAKGLGVEIPTLCHLKELAPDGSCRMCVVEVEGGRRGGLTTACTAHCQEDMVVSTHSEKVADSRRFILDLLLSNHKLECFSCGKNGDCQLQQYALDYGIDATSFTEGKRMPCHQEDTSNPFFSYDPEKCIMCRRCARVCQLRQGRDVLSIANRGFETKMMPSYGQAFDQSICESCGNCVSSCPTGALTAKDTKEYRKWETQKIPTTCPHCGTGCQMNLLVKNNRLVGVEPLDGPANKNLLCVKGKFASYKFVGSGDRLTEPLIKRNGIFEPASWEEALTLVSSKFNEIKAENGPDALAGFSCSRATNEDNYVFQKMVRAAFGTNNVDNCARVCHSASVHGLAQTLGSGAMTNPIADITEDVDMILLVGSNPEEAHPVIGAQIRQAIQRGTQVVVVDPRKINLVKDSALHLQVQAGTNVAFANGMMHVILKEGLADRHFIEERTEGFLDLEKMVADYTPEKVAEICHIHPEDLIQAARMYAKAEKAPIIYCLGVTEHSTGTEGVMSMSNLAMLVGKVGKPGCGVNPLRGQNNVQGACDMGCMPYDFPGYQKVNNPEVIDKFEKAWHVPLNRNTGLTSTKVLPAATAGNVKGLYIFGEDPIVTDPDTGHVRQALESLDFLVVQELFMTETAAYADVVLPGISYAEKDGTFTNTERRVQRVRKAVEPRGQAREDYEIFCEVMTRMGYPCAYESAKEIMEEISAVTPSFGGINYERLEKESLQWPCRSLTDPGTPIMHVGSFARGKGLFKAIPYKQAQELPDEEYPYLMSTGRMLYHYNTRAMTGRTEGINQIANHSYIEINAVDAQALGIQEGDKVEVHSRRGKIETYAAVGNRVFPQEVFMTFHFPDGNVNEITNAVFDDIATIPEYKVCAVAIKPVNK